MPRTLVWLAALAVIGLLLAPGTGSGANAAFQIVDRTLRCPMVGVGYPDSIRVLDVSATRFDPTFDSSPRTSVRNGGGGGPYVGVGVQTGPGPGHTGLVWLSRTGCTATKLRVSLSGTGLKAGATERAEYRCDVPATVLIRVRAVFKRPTAFSVDPRLPSETFARGDIATGYLAVATVRRKPIFFGSVHDATGKARIFVAPSRCARRQG
jgi:hypothetical protein